jgi:hypothetical protein
LQSFHGETSDYPGFQRLTVVNFIIGRSSPPCQTASGKPCTASLARNRAAGPQRRGPSAKDRFRCRMRNRQSFPSEMAKISIPPSHAISMPGPMIGKTRQKRVEPKTAGAAAMLRRFCCGAMIPSCLLRRFIGNRDDNVVLALAALPLFGFVGAAVDFSRTASTFRRHAAALDAPDALQARPDFIGRRAGTKLSRLFQSLFTRPKATTSKSQPNSPRRCRAAFR